MAYFKQICGNINERTSPGSFGVAQSSRSSEFLRSVNYFDAYVKFVLFQFLDWNVQNFSKDKKSKLRLLLTLIKDEKQKWFHAKLATFWKLPEPTT